MSRGLGDTQAWVLGFIRGLHSDAYQCHVYEFGQEAGYSKPSIARAIKTLENRGLVRRKGKGKFRRIIAV